MTNLSIFCPHCGTQYEIQGKHIGLTAECGECGSEFVVKPVGPAALAGSSFSSYDQNQYASMNGNVSTETSFALSERSSTERRSYSTDAHLLLLTKFLRPKRTKEFDTREDWASALGESPQTAIERFRQTGLLKLGDLSAQLHSRFTVPELKRLLRTYGLKVSGRKAELVSRLVGAEPQKMQTLVADFPVVVCSDGGRRIAEDYREMQQAQRLVAEHATLEALRQRAFAVASQCVAEYQAHQVFSVGLGVNWSDYDTSMDVLHLEAIFSYRPESLRDLPPAVLDEVRIVACMLALWGDVKDRSWFPECASVGFHKGAEAAASILFRYGRSQGHLAMYEQARAEGVDILLEVDPAEDACEACKEYVGKTYTIEAVPELPNPRCTHKKGCRCMYIPADLDGF